MGVAEMEVMNKAAKVNRTKRLPIHVEAPLSEPRDEENERPKRKRRVKVRRHPRSPNYHVDEAAKVTIESAYASGDGKVSKEAEAKRPLVGRLCNMKRFACFSIVGLALFLIMSIYFSAGIGSGFELTYCAKDTCAHDSHSMCKMEGK